MPGRRWWVGAVLMLLSASVGCCGFCDRWCGNRTAAVPVGTCACAPVVCCPAPAAQTAGAAPVAGTWNAGCVPCVPLAAPAPQSPR